MATYVIRFNEVYIEDDQAENADEAVAIAVELIAEEIIGYTVQVEDDGE